MNNLLNVPAHLLARFSRFSPVCFGDEMFQLHNGAVPFQKYLDFFASEEWWKSEPAILAVVPDSASKLVEGHRRAVTYAYLNRGPIPTIHCYSQEECAYHLKEIYGKELTVTRNATLKKTCPQNSR